MPLRISEKLLDTCHGGLVFYVYNAITPSFRLVSRQHLNVSDNGHGAGDERGMNDVAGKTAGGHLR